MLEEAVVLGGEERVDHHLRDLLACDGNAALLADHRDQLAVARIHRERQLHCELAELRGVRELGRDVLVGARESEQQGHGDRERGCERGHDEFSCDPLHAQI